MAVLAVDKNNFAQEVLVSPKPVLVDFYASWCTPCKMLSPILEEISREHPEVTIGKVDVSREQELAQYYQITSVPALLLFQDGKPVKTSLGFQPKRMIKEMLQ